MELKSTLGLNKTIEDIKRGKFFAVYLIYGDENYLVKEATQKIIEAILPEKGSPSLETFEGDKDWDNVILSLKTYPFFGSKRIVSVKNTEIFYSKFVVEEVLERSKEEFERSNIDDAVKLFRIALGYLKIEEVTDEVGNKLENFLELSIDLESKKWIKKIVGECLSQDLKPIPYEDNSDKLNNVLKKGIPQCNILVLCTGSVDKRKRLYKTINDIGIIIDLSIQRMRRDPAEIDEEERRTLQQQANELLKSSDKIFAKGAFDTLANKTGYNVGIFLNELEKVIVLVKDRQRIEVKDIEEAVGRTKEDSIFDLQEALGRRDLEKAMLYLSELLGQGEFYLVLLLGIAKEIWRLIAAKEFIENELKVKWNPKMDTEAFKKFIYFPIKRKEKESQKEEQKKSGSNIFKLPPNVLLELLKSSEYFTKEELYRFVKLLAETDLKTKTTRVLPVHLLEKALVEICLGKESSKKVANL